MLLEEHPELAPAVRERLDLLRRLELGARAGDAPEPPVEIEGFRPARAPGARRDGRGLSRRADVGGAGWSRSSCCAAVRWRRSERSSASDARRCSSVGSRTPTSWPCTPPAWRPVGSTLVMELVPGRGLDEVFAERRSDPSAVPTVEVVRLCRDVARALAVAHDAGLVHRDVKPSNVRVTPEGRAVLLDFGLARAQGEETLSQTGAFLGTPQYAAPEQISGQGGDVGAAADVYALGVTLYQGVTGHAPFEGASSEELFHRVLTQAPQRPRALGGDIPRDLETVLLTALEKDRDRRYGTAAELAEDLDAVLTLGADPSAAAGADRSGGPLGAGLPRVGRRDRGGAPDRGGAAREHGAPCARGAGRTGAGPHRARRTAPRGAAPSSRGRQRPSRARARAPAGNGATRSDGRRVRGARALRE